MSENLKKYFKTLEFTSNIKCKNTQNKLLSYLANDPKIYLALKEVAINVIKGNIELNRKQKLKLIKHKKLFHKLINKQSKQNQKKLVVQSGGWLWLLPVVSTVIDLIK
jgi:hypothetical protein